MKINANFPIERKYYIEIGLLETMEFIFDDVSTYAWDTESILICMKYVDDFKKERTPFFWHRTAK